MIERACSEEFASLQGGATDWPVLKTTQEAYRPGSDRTAFGPPYPVQNTPLLTADPSEAAYPALREGDQEPEGYLYGQPARLQRDLGSRTW